MNQPSRQESLFAKLSPGSIDCLRAFGKTLTVQDEEYIFRENECTETFFILLSGQIKIFKQIAGNDVVLTVHDPGEFTGELSVLTGGRNLASGQAIGESQLLQILKCRFNDAIGACPEMLTVVIPALARRLPDAMVLQSQREKLVSLGTLAAGLAHELNNPASAAQRSAAQLREILPRHRQSAFELCFENLSHEQLERLGSTMDRLHPRVSGDLDPLARSDLETQIARHLQEMEVQSPWETAAALVDSGITKKEVQEITADFPCSALQKALQWLAISFETDALVRDIEDSMSRVGDLVQSIKTYSYLDQAPLQEIDVVPGLDNTLMMLGHKLRRNGIEIRKEYSADMPRITAYAGELNQVWTNLIDNAIDAMSEGGVLTLRAMPEADCVLVQVEDTGTGIAPEVLPRIFDPFFTTKGVGEGTGMGLDIVYKIVVEHHKGDLSVESTPGKAVFNVRLPFERSDRLEDGGRNRI